MKLGSVLELMTDYHANGSYKVLKENVELKDSEDYALMIRTKNFEQNDFSDSVKYIDQNAYEFLSKSKVYTNDILMNKIANAGAVYIMPDLGRPVSLAMNLFLLRVNLEVADPIYVFCYLKLNEHYVRSFAQGSVTKTITKDAVRNIEIVLPSLETQKNIAEKYEIFSKRIDLLRKENLVLSETLQNRFRRITQKTSLSADRSCKFGDLANPRRGQTITKKKVTPGSVPVVAGGIKPAYFHNQANVNGPVITVSASGTAGFVNFFYENIWASDCSYISSAETDKLYFALSFLRENQNKILRLSHGAVQKHINPSDLSDLEVVMPCDEDINKFEKFASKIHDKIKINSIQINVATELRKKFLNSLIAEVSNQ